MANVELSQRKGYTKKVIAAFVPFLEGLEAIVGAERISAGDFAKVHYFVDSTSYFAQVLSQTPPRIRITGHDGNFQQAFTFSFDIEEAKAIKNYLSEKGVRMK